MTAGRSAIELSHAVRRQQRAARRARAKRVRRGLGREAPGETHGTQNYAWQTHCFIPAPTAAHAHSNHRLLLPKLTGPAAQRRDIRGDDAMAWTPGTSDSHNDTHERAMLLPALDRLERRRALWVASDPVHRALHETMYVPSAGLPGSMLPPLEDCVGEDGGRTNVAAGEYLARTCNDKLTSMHRVRRAQRQGGQNLAGGRAQWSMTTDIEPVQIKQMDVGFLGRGPGPGSGPGDGGGGSDGDEPPFAITQWC